MNWLPNCLSYSPATSWSADSYNSSRFPALCFACSKPSVSASCCADRCLCDGQTPAWLWPLLTFGLIPCLTSLIPLIGTSSETPVTHTHVCSFWSFIRWIDGMRRLACFLDKSSFPAWIHPNVSLRMAPSSLSSSHLPSPNSHTGEGAFLEPEAVHQGPFQFTQIVLLTFIE